jgi:uncharacterized protein YbcI
MPPSQDDTPARNELAASISNVVVKLTSQYTGRGPTMARTHINDDLITVVLRETLTKGEQSLVRDGKEDIVMAMRLQFQMTMRQDLVAAIEQLTGRKVLAFLSSNHMKPDIAIESFVMERDSNAH